MLESKARTGRASGAEVKMRKAIAAAIVALSLAGCAQTGDSAGGEGWGLNKQTGGTLIGALGGGLVGSQFGSGSGKLAATAAGTLLGAFVGNEVGQSLDRADQAYAKPADQKALETAPTGQSIAWNNPDNGHSGTITPEKTYQAPSGQYCREFQQTVTINGQPQQSYGTACRQPDGSWKTTE